MSFSGWREVRLGDLLNFRRGHDLSKTNLSEGVIPVVGSNGIIGFHNIFTTKSPCLTIGRSGNIGNPFYLNKDCWAHNTTLYVDDFKNNDPKYLYYLLKILDLRYYGGGSAVPTLNRNHIHPIMVRSTDNILEQKAIAATLSCLDGKIELNNRINKTLEEMAQVIFKSWFVDFEPFQDGEFEDSEMGRIPKGWKVGFLRDILTLNYGKSLTAKNRTYGKIKVYSSAGITGFHNEVLVNEPSIIIGRKGTIGTVYYSTEPSFCIDTAYYATQKDSEFPLFVMYQLLKELKLQQYNEDSAVPGLNRNKVYSINILIPPDDILNQYSNILTSIYNLIFDDINQTSTLTSIRDSLLPKLMSGEIKIPVEGANT